MKTIKLADGAHLTALLTTIFVAALYLRHCSCRGQGFVWLEKGFTFSGQTSVHHVDYISQREAHHTVSNCLKPKDDRLKLNVFVICVMEGAWEPGDLRKSLERSLISTAGLMCPGLCLSSSSSSKAARKGVVQHQQDHDSAVLSIL